MASGRPWESAKSRTSWVPVTGSLVPGTSGAPTFSAMWRAWTLSPSLAIASGDGPIHVRPASMTFWANSAFSERKP